MLLRLFAITSKEVRQLARDRLTFGMIVGIPLMQILLFGYAINFDVRDLDAAVVDDARTSHSRALVADLQATGVIVLRPPSPRPVGPAPADGERRDQRRVVIPNDFERRRLGNDRAVAQILVNGSEPMIDAVARGLASVPLPCGRGITGRARPFSRCAPNTTRNDAPQCRSCQP